MNGEEGERMEGWKDGFIQGEKDERPTG